MDNLHDSNEPVAYGMWDTMLGKENRMMMVRLDKGQDGCTVPLYTTPPQPEQEPVGLIESLKDAKPCCGEYETCWRACTPRGKFLGQRDAQRTWVGLTQEDIDIAFDETQEGGGFWEFADAIEAKLKEKNGL